MNTILTVLDRKGSPEIIISAINQINAANAGNIFKAFRLTAIGQGALQEASKTCTQGMAAQLQRSSVDRLNGLLEEISSLGHDISVEDPIFLRCFQKVASAFASIPVDLRGNSFEHGKAANFMEKLYVRTQQHFETETNNLLRQCLDCDDPNTISAYIIDIDKFQARIKVFQTLLLKEKYLELIAMIGNRKKSFC